MRKDPVLARSIIAILIATLLTGGRALATDCPELKTQDLCSQTCEDIHEADNVLTRHQPRLYTPFERVFAKRLETTKSKAQTEAQAVDTEADRFLAVQTTNKSFADERARILIGFNGGSGHVRKRDPYSIRPSQNANATSLSCVTLRDGTFEPLGDCAHRNPDGSYVVVPEALRQLDFGRWGLATMAIRKEGYAYVRRDGRALAVPNLENFPDEFISGLVRVRIGEKLGYANRRLKVVIPAIYDGAYPFAKGRGWVCIGCVSVSDGDHSFYKGGTALCIDQRGRKRREAECGNAGWLPAQLRE